jgi:uncharacterized membrane protein
MKKAVPSTDYSFTDFIHQSDPALTDMASLSADQLNKYRKEYIELMLQQESEELTAVSKKVNKDFRQRGTTGLGLPDKNSPSTFGNRLADNVAAFGGSWRFIILFFSILTGWMILNAWWLSNKGFDPYPFILLNLILSCLAAIQAPIIMMSQNRQEEKDRQRAEHDYKVNLKAEAEIRMLHEKLDHILIHQNKRLLEVQKVQMEMMENISRMIQQGK